MHNNRIVITKRIIGLWVIGGMIYNMSSCTYHDEVSYYGIPCDTTASVSYVGRIKTIIDTRCATANCHGTTNAQNGIELTNYQQVKDGIESIGMMCNIRHESGCIPMPKDQPKLSACDILALEKWQALGFPNE